MTKNVSEISEGALVATVHFWPSMENSMELKASTKMSLNKEQGFPTHRLYVWETYSPRSRLPPQIYFRSVGNTEEVIMEDS